MIEARSYDDVRPTLKTGDLVLMTGKGLISATIRKFTRSAWSHIGMVMRIAEFDTVLLWEATTLGSVLDVMEGRPKKGVRLVPLSHRVGTPGQTMAVRQLKGTLLDDQQIQTLAELRQQLNGRPYEQDYVELLRSAYDGPFGQNSEDLDTVFCSELVAECYQALGLLTEDTPSNEYVPGDFASDGKNALVLTKGYLGPEIAIIP